MIAGPSRRRAAMLIVASLVLAGAVGGSLQAGRPAPLRRSARPNIVLIVTDDQRFDTVEQMPSVRALAEHGVRFANAFATTPLCCPSRASILTGQYSHRTGVLSNSPPDGGAPAFSDTSTLATWLQGAGYTTAMIGKYLNRYKQLGPAYVPPGWDEWSAIASEPISSRYYGFTLNRNGSPLTYTSTPYAYSTSVLGRYATDFLRSVTSPFFLYFAPIAPHLPATPAPGDEGASPAGTPDPASFDEADTSDKPWAGIFPPMSASAREAMRSMRARTRDSLREVDRSVAAIAETLVERRALDNTVIVYTSDNGQLLGEHRLRGKIWPYEESIRVPLVVRLPWARPPGAVEERLVLNIDLAPTLAELAGVRPAITQDGRSLVPLLRPERAPPRWRSAFVVEYLGHEFPFGAPPRFTAVRTRRYLYAHYENGWLELYDLRTDPFQLENLAGQVPRLERRLAARLEDLLAGSEGVPGA
jgi:arylsulfatase A-like enzyme